MAYRRKYKRRKSKKEWLKDKVARSRSAKSRREWMDKLIAYCSMSYRKPKRFRSWSFNRKRY